MTHISKLPSLRRREFLKRASAQAAEPNSERFAPLMATAPPALIWYCTAWPPDMNTALPETLMQLKVALPLLARNWSARRPPQPEVAPSGRDDCQRLDWSLCENSLGGSGTLAALYWASVVGCISGPMLSITPSRPASKTGLSRFIVGARASCRPSGSARDGVSAVAASCSRGIARAWRMLA